MRTTLDIEDDVLAATKALARQQGRSAGSVVSAMLRKALTGSGAAEARSGGKRVASVAGFQPFAADGRVVTNDLINAIRDREGV